MRKNGMVNIVKKVLAFSMFIGLLWLISCEKSTFEPPTVDPGKQVSFQNDVQPLFTSKCIGCHGTGKNQPTLQEGSSYNSLTQGGYVNTAKPEQSRIYVQITTNAGHKSILNDLQKQTILAWIKQGAKNN